MTKERTTAGHKHIRTHSLSAIQATDNIAHNAGAKRERRQGRLLLLLSVDALNANTPPRTKRPSSHTVIIHMPQKLSCRGTAE
jgi:hypothetical protein